MNIEKTYQEMKRGVLTLAVLTQTEEKQYGYSLIKILEEKEFPIGQDTLYPLLRRLEEQNLLNCDWQLDEKRPRKYYQISDEGKSYRKELIDFWEKQTICLRRLVNEII